MNQTQLHYVNSDLGNVVLPQARSHFCLQLPWIDSRRDIEQEHHLPLVFIERGTLKPALVGDEQRLHRAKDRLRVFSVVESDPDPAARVRIKPVDEYPTESSNEDCHRPRSHTARESYYHDHDCLPGEFRIIEQGPKSEQRADTEDDKRERLAGPAQFSDNRADYAKKYQRLAFLKIRKWISKRGAPRMPRDCVCTAHCQAKTEKEPQYEFWMPKLLDALLDRHPRIALGINSSSGSGLGQFFRWVSTQPCRRQHTYKTNDSGHRDCAQRPTETAVRTKQTWQHCLPVSYQNQIPSRPGCSIGVSLTSLHSHSFFPRTRTGAIGINSSRNYVLACRQVATVLCALGKASHVLAIHRQDKAEIFPKICHPGNDHMP